LQSHRSSVVPKGGTAWVAIAKQLQLSQWDATEGGNYFIIKITYIEFMSNSHARHGVVVPAWDTVAVGNKI
jgi:hypothetical protein